MTPVLSSHGSHRRITVLLVGALALLGACGGASKADPGPGPTLLTSPSTTTTVAPVTTTTTTTVAPTTTVPVTTTTTTVAPTTTAAAVTDTLPAPIAPPPAGASEPLVQVGRIEIPAIGVDKPMYDGITLKTLNEGPGHWPGTAMPGKVGNSVIAGHRTSHNKDFRNIDKLQPGDEIIFTDDSGRYVYTVTRTEVVQPDAMWIVDQTTSATATLFACHPPGSTRERIVVFADLAT